MSFIQQIKTSFTTLAPNSDPWCTDQLRRAQPVAGRLSVCRAVHSSTISPLSPYTGNTSPLIPSKHQSHPVCDVQHLSTFHQWTGSVYGTVPFCSMQPLEGWDRRGERQAVKQFPPSESHSDPHTGDWGLTPARRWHKHWQTKDLSLWASVDLRGSKSTKNRRSVTRGFVMMEIEIVGLRK